MVYPMIKSIVSNSIANQIATNNSIMYDFGYELNFKSFRTNVAITIAYLLTNVAMIDY